MDRKPPDLARGEANRIPITFMRDEFGMRHFLIAAFAWLFCLAGVPARANGVPPMPLRTQLLRADLVTIGRLGAPTTCQVGGRRHPCAELATEVILKGAWVLGARRYLILNWGVMEQSVENVQIPDSALFFLVRMPAFTTDGGAENAEFYTAVQGRRSILPVTDPNAETP